MSVLKQIGVSRICLAILMLVATLAPLTLEAQVSTTPQVSGQIVDEGRQPMIGVTILVRGTQRATVTNNHGEFKINAAEGAELELAYLGYESKVVRVMSTMPSIIEMKPSAADIDEVVVIGYGSQRKSDLTGAIASITEKEIEEVPTVNVFEALSGKIAGMQVSLTSEPGSTAAINIRGIGTYDDSSPICIIDGQISEMDDMTSINPADIKSMSILKDAASTAIYGSRGANGVIIITTKGNEVGDRPMVVNAGAYYSISEMEREVNLTNLSQWYQIQNLSHMADNYNDPVAAANIPYPDWQSAGEGIDWQDVVTRTAHTYNANMSINGGTRKSSFFLSSSYLNQEGIVEETSYDRFTARLNASYSPKSWMKVGVNSTFTYDNTISADSNVFKYAGKRNPEGDIYDLNEDGTYEEGSYSGGRTNPAALLYYTHDRYNKSWTYTNNLYLELKLSKQLKFRSSISNTTKTREKKTFIPAFMEDVDNASDYYISQLTHYTSVYRSWLQENTINYDTTIGRHEISLMGGATLQRTFNQYSQVSATGLSWDAWKNQNLWYVSQGSNITGTDGGSEKSYASFFSRANYSYDDKYIFTASGRFDGSSQYATSNQFGFFPSFAGAWIASKEDFMKDVSWVSFLKTRLSWGLVGNDRGAQGSSDLYASTVDVVMGADNTVEKVEQLVLMVDTTLTWEETATLNLGVDFGFLGDLISGSVELYNKVTNNVMMPLSIQPTGTSVTSNIGKVGNKGAEMTLSVRPKFNEVTTSFDFTAAYNKNEVIEIRDNIGAITNLPNQTLEGYPIGGLWGYETIGVFQNDEQLAQMPALSGTRVGDLMYRDVNGDGYIDSNDYVYLGSYLPSVMLGFTARASWKGLSVMLELGSSLGHKSYNYRFSDRSEAQNGLTQMLDAWTCDGSTNVHPRIFDSDDTSSSPSDYFIENCDYLSIRNAQISYSVPKSLLKKLSIKTLRVYVNASNLYTFTAMTGYRPDNIYSGTNANSGGIDKYGIYPNSRSYTLGFATTF